MAWTLLTNWEKGINCFCWRKLEYGTGTVHGEIQRDKIKLLECDKCLRPIALVQLLPDSGNGFLSIISDKIFSALGYGKDQILPVGRGISVKGASGNVLQVLGCCKDIPVYLGGKRIVLISPCVISGLSGAEIILYPGTLDHLDAQHVYINHTIEFKKLPLSVHLFSAPIISRWLAIHKEANHAVILNTNRGKKSKTKLVSGYVLTSN